MFAATLADAFTEILQNARRAGARRVHVAVAGSEGNTAVTVTDDGAGIADAGVLLSFAENGWSEDLVRREDAAGMGMLSLARRGCTVSSRPRNADGEPAPGWRVDLAPEHFLGEAEAEVRTDDAAPYPHGTAVTFRTTDDARGHPRWRRHRRLALPASGRVRAVRRTPPPGESRSNAAPSSTARSTPSAGGGSCSACSRTAGRAFGLNDPDVNFHGLTVSVRLPSVETVAGARWSVAADIVDCPELELVLPARKEAVETPFLAEMREAARLAIYRAMAADPDPRPAFDDWKRARDAGIDIAAPPAELRPWRPVIADVDDWQEPPKRQPVGADALRMEYEPEPPEAQTFWRAARGNAVAERLFETDRRLEGYGWYDAIPRVVNLHTQVTLKGKTCALDAYSVPERTGAPEAPLPQRPDAIRVSLAVRRTEGPRRILDLATDLAFAGEAWSWVHDALPLVAADSLLEPWELAQLLRAGFFSPSDDADADSWERQRTDFEQEALHLATRLLCSDDQARITTIADAVARELFWLIPHDRGAEISVRDRKVTVTLGKPVGEAA